MLIQYKLGNVFIGRRNGSKLIPCFYGSSESNLVSPDLTLFISQNDQIIHDIFAKIKESCDYVKSFVIYYDNSNNKINICFRESSKYKGTIYEPF